MSRHYYDSRGRRRCRDHSSSSSSGDHLFSESSEESLGLSQKRHEAGSNSLNHALNSLAGLPLPLGATRDAPSQSARLLSVEEALPRMQENAARYESQTRVMGTLVNASTLSPTQLSQVRTNAIEALQLDEGFTPLSVLPPEKQKALYNQQQSGLAHFSELSSHQQAQVRLNSAKSTPTQSAIVDNKESILRNKNLFDVQFAQTMSDETLRAAFLGKPLSASMASPLDDTLSLDCHMGAHGELVMGHLKKRHPYYCKLIEEEPGLKKYVCQLLHRPDKDYLIIVPTRRFLDEYGLAGRRGRVLEVVGSHMALFERKDKAPVVYELKNRSLYDYQTALTGQRIQLRRINSDLIEVNGAWMARRDEGGHGRVYVMQDLSTSQRAAAKQRLENATALSADPELIALPEERAGELGFVRVEEQVPRLTSGQPLSTETMQPVSQTGAYRQPKLALLLTKMLDANYSVTRDMSRYMALGAPLSNSGTQSSAVSDVFLKVYSVDDIYNDYLTNALSNGTEYLSLIGAHQFSAAQSQPLDLGDALALREYRAHGTEISKSTLLNHVAVVSFTRDNQLCMASFRVHDEDFARGVYMSPSEAVVLRFKNNQLDTLTLNHASQGFGVLDYDAEADLDELNDGVAMRLEMDRALSTRMETRELTFEQFADLVVPLCAPSFLKRAKAALKGATQPTVQLMVDQNPVRLDQDEKVGPEVTKRVMVMIGSNAVTAAKNKHSYTFQRQTWRSTSNASEHIDVFTLQGTNRRPLSFAALVDKKGRSKVLSLTVPDPITQRERQVVFKLSNTANVTSNAYWQGATRGGLRFHFELDASGNLEQFAIEYVKSSSGTTSTRTRPKPAPEENTNESSSTSAPLTPLTGFLCDEAYKLQQLQVPVNHHYLQARLEQLLARVRPVSATQASRFFDALVEQCARETSTLKMDDLGLLSNLNEQHFAVLKSCAYVSPGEQVCTRCADVFNADFARLDAGDVMRQVQAFTRANQMSQRDCALFYSRFSCVLQQVVAALRK